MTGSRQESITVRGRYSEAKYLDHVTSGNGLQGIPSNYEELMVTVIVFENDHR